MWQKIKNIYHLIQAILANIWYGFPSKDMIVIGVTGTDGKTTTASLMYHILNAVGQKAAVVTSVSALIDGRSYNTGFHVTTPDSFSLQSYFKKAREAGVKYFVLETTSHALDQNRIFGVHFTIGIVTNITKEHLDYHKTWKNYIATKTKLLQMAEVAIINKDDASFPFIYPKIKRKKILTYSLHDDADITFKKYPYKTQLIGEFNKYNTLAAIGACIALHLEEKDIQKAVFSFHPPSGREEVVYTGQFSVMVDFAHTPNSIEQILKTLKTDKKRDGRIIHVFGSAGERDKYKRPEMGRLSAKYADILIITAEDPRSESIDEITKQIQSGIKKTHAQIIIIPDRSEAIHQAIAIAQKNDIVVLTGKGHEQSMNYGHGEILWSEHEEVKKAIQARSILANNQ